MKKNNMCSVLSVLVVFYPSRSWLKSPEVNVVVKRSFRSTARRYTACKSTISMVSPPGHSAGLVCGKPHEMMPSDIVGVIAAFLPPTTRYQQPLMLVNSIWYQGVVQQDGMKPKPMINWPLDALVQRQPTRLQLLNNGNYDDLLQLADPQFSTYVQRLNLSRCMIFDDDVLQLEEEYAAQQREEGTQQPPQLTHLKELDLSDCEELGDEGIISFVFMAPHLTSLRLDHCSNITNATMQCIMDNLVWLTDLNVKGCFFVSEDGFRGVENKLTRLRSLDLESCRVSDTIIEGLVGLPELTSLNLKACSQLTDDALQHCSKMDRLTSLAAPPKITDDGLRHLSQLEHLAVLHVDAPEVSNDGFDHISNIKTLSEFHFNNGSSTRNLVSDRGFQKLRKLGGSLKTLKLQNIHRDPYRTTQTITDRGTVYTVLALPSLTTFTADDCRNVEDGTVMALCDHCPQLTHLSLNGCCSLSNNGLSQLKKLEKLRVFQLFANHQLTGACNKYIARLPQLTELVLHGQVVDDAGLQLIASRLTHLVKLDLTDCDNITDRGLKHLSTNRANLERLNTLHLIGCVAITDVGVMSIVQHLHNLTLLRLDGCLLITEATVEAMEALCIGYSVCGCGIENARVC